jgi:gamma-glutamyl-gamma-aminobutyrate hydrolase PuuD
MDYGITLKDFLPKDFVVLPGGADINPKLYGKPNLASYYDDTTDALHIAKYKNAVKKGTPVLAICRGHQLLAAMNNLTLIQDLDHPGHHNITVRDDNREFTKTIAVNSLHHQNVWTNNKLEGDNYEVYGYTKLSKNYVYGKYPINVTIEPEIIWYPKVKALGVQFHPEMMSGKHYKDCLEYLEKLINKLF